MKSPNKLLLIIKNKRVGKPYSLRGKGEMMKNDIFKIGLPGFLVMCFLALVPAALLATTVPGSVEVEKGEKASTAKDKTLAKKWFLKAAEKGNEIGQYRLANLYLDDNTIISVAAMAGALWAKDHPLVKNDPKFNSNAQKMLKWARKSAEQGYAPAQELMVEIYAGEQNTPEIDDIVVKVDKAEAIKWYTKAADQGNVDAKEALKKLN